MKKIQGRYEIKSKIGEGGMGVVFRAYDPPPMDRDVAIKTLPEFADRLALDLFYKECNVLKAISHPNIVEIFDMGEFEDAGVRKPFFVMPLLHGQTLDEIIRNAPHRLTVDRVVDIVSQVCRGLQAAHEHGLIHRDIKPSNLFVIGDDAVKIIDFGVAQAVDMRSRSGSLSKGTLLYMAPEQVLNKPVSPQSDIFSLGVVCYEALTRRHPFRGATEEEIVDAIRRLNPPPASAINDAVSQLMSRVVHKAMAKQPLNRYDSAKELADILQRALHNAPIEIFDPARLQPRIDRARKALDSGDVQFAGEIVSELEAGGNIDPQISDLRTEVDKVVRQRTIAQLLESAQARYEEEEDPLALQKLHEVLQIDPGNMDALGLKGRIELRRSERQVEQWMRLAKQHIENHSYSHARDALQNVLAIRPKESRALRLAKEIEADEQDYLQRRQEKAALYESAVNAWKNGDVSEALSHMRLVLDLDRQAPDISMPESAASYQGFYNKIRSEHETLINGYNDAKRRLAEHDFVRALEICQEFLAKYPGQPLFKALKVDVEEQHRQRLSSYIADVNRGLEAEPDLDAKVSLVREAVALYPGEPHFERLLKLMEEKRDLVRSIVMRAESHEGRGQINEALSDLETLTSIYPAYPGLKYEIERLEKRREQQSRGAAKADWVRKIDRQLESGNYARALEFLDKADGDFSNDAELVELRKLTEQGHGRSQRAEQMLDEGQQLYAAGQIAEGTDLLRAAQQLDDRNPAVRTALRDALIDHARSVIDTDWRTAEALVDDALDLDPQHPVAKSLRTQVFDRRRDDTITQCAAQARRLQADHELEKAEAELRRVLALYPGDPRLTVILDTVQKELGHESRKRARATDLEQLRDLRQRAETVDDQEELQSIFARTRQVADRHVGENGRSDLETVARDIERIVVARAGRAPSAAERPVDAVAAAAMTVAIPAGAAAAVTMAPAVNVSAQPAVARQPAAAVGKSTKSAPASRSARNKMVALAAVAALVVIAVGVGAVVRYRMIAQRNRMQTAAALATPAGRASIRVRTTPPGGSITVDGQAQGTSDVQLALDAGDHQIGAALVGYTPTSRTVSLAGGAVSEIELVLQPIGGATGPVLLSQQRTAQLRIQRAAPGLQVLLDDDAAPIGTVGASGTFSYDVPAGSHVVRLALDGYQTRKLTRDFAAGDTVSLSAADVDLQAAPSSLEIVADPTMEVTVSNDKQTIRRFSGGSKLAVTQGTYAIVGKDSALGTSVSETVTIGPGESKTVSLKVVVGGMERFEHPGEWTQSGTWFLHRGGGFVLYDQSKPHGRIAFTMKPRRSRNFLRGGPRLRWVVGYSDARNYMLVEMDDKYLYRAELVDGRRTDLPRVEHKISWDNPFVNISIEVTDTRLIHQFSLEKEPWKVFDTWDRRSPGSAASTRTFADGKFGFYLPGSEEIEVSNFAFYPAGR